MSTPLSNPVGICVSNASVIHVACAGSNAIVRLYGGQTTVIAGKGTYPQSHVSHMRTVSHIVALQGLIRQGFSLRK